jgi:chromosome segregation ATPase
VLQQHLELLWGELGRVQQEVAGLVGKVSAWQHADQRDLELLEGWNQGAQQEVACLGDLHDRLYVKLLASEEEVASVHGEAAALHEELEVSQREAAELQAQLGSSRQDVARLQAASAGLATQLDGSRQEAAELGWQLTSSRHDGDSLRFQLAQAQADIERLTLEKVAPPIERCFVLLLCHFCQPSAGCT